MSVGYLELISEQRGDVERGVGIPGDRIGDPLLIIAGATGIDDLVSKENGLRTSPSNLRSTTVCRPTMPW